MMNLVHRMLSDHSSFFLLRPIISIFDRQWLHRAWIYLYKELVRRSIRPGAYQSWRPVAETPKIALMAALPGHIDQNDIRLVLNVAERNYDVIHRQIKAAKGAKKPVLNVVSSPIVTCLSRYQH